MKPIRACMLSVSGLELTSFEKQLLHKANPLGVILFKRNIQSTDQVKKLSQSIQEVIGRENVWIAVDQEGGRVCRFEVPERPFMAQRAIGFLETHEAVKATKLQAHLMGDILLNAGVNVNFAPCLDVADSQTANVLKSRCFSEDEKKVAELGQVLIETYLKKGILPCMKHLPGHGKATVDPHLHLPMILADLKALQKDFYPFQKAAPYCPLGMTAHIIVSEIDAHVPATQSVKVIREVIRGRIGFQGFLLSDALEMKALSGSLREKTHSAVRAGCDAVCYCLGEENGLTEVVSAAPFLTTEAYERFEQAQKYIMHPYEATPDNALSVYLELQKKAPILSDDYDAVEVLNRLKTV